MRSKVIQSHINLKHAVLGIFLLLILLVLLLRSSFSSAPPPQSTSTTKAAAGPSLPAHPSPSCDKIPPSLAQAIVHYATSNNTPQQTLKEISVTARVLARRSPCNFLVFGLGHDSLMWAALNHGGRTVFLEEDAAWIRTARRKLPSLEAYHVAYNTRVRQADALLEYGKSAECTSAGDDPRSSGCPLALRELPAVVLETEWDLIMVDAPTGYFEEAPGRMGAIYTAGMMARGRREGETDVFVHDVNRPVEDRFSKAFLCEGYLAEQEGLLRHFTIPSHRAEPGRPFCPAV